jgi:glycosyltransferase involved in cell wall biosynthesis
MSTDSWKAGAPEDPDISIVTPLHNEEENLPHFYAAVVAVLERHGRDFELILVNDGSTDATARILDGLAESDPRVRPIHFIRNFGQHAGIQAGLRHSRGRIVAVMDGDMQHDPEDLPALLGKMEEGWHMVSGVRQGRRESLWLRRLPSLAANYLLQRATGCRVKDSGGFKCIRGDVARSLIVNKGQHRFLPAMVYLSGGTIAELPIRAPERLRGKSHYTLGRAFDVFLDIMLFWFQRAYLVNPLHLMGRISACFTLGGGGVLAWITYEKLVRGVPMGDRPALILSVLSLLLGFLVLMLGFVAEMISSLSQVLSDRMPYIIASSLDREVTRIAARPLSAAPEAPHPHPHPHPPPPPRPRRTAPAPSAGDPAA